MYKKYKGDKNLLQNADIFLLKVHHTSYVMNKILYIVHNFMNIIILQLGEIPMLSTRLDLLFTVREFPVNFEGFKPVCNSLCSLVHSLNNALFVYPSYFPIRADS